jgi:preprotein translocase subunit SecA
MLKFITKVVGTKNDRELKRFGPLIAEVNRHEAEIKTLSDEGLHAKTGEFREQIARGVILDDLLPEAFAVCREAAVRAIGQRHFDVQLIGGIALHQGRIAEMKTGEGKTLVATLPVYLNALTGKGVHVVTVNDYLARRDAEWMGRIYKRLGLTVGVVLHGIDDRERQAAYGADVTYGQNNEFGFDYLRDNMKFAYEDYVQRELNFAIVDECDSILIDEARTPLIISGPAEEATEKYYVIDRVIPRLAREEHFTVDEKLRSVVLTEDGVAEVEKLLNVSNLYDPGEIDTLHHVNQALKAHVIFKNDVDYVVKDGEVLIVDEFTGRLMPGRRWSDGLHQAVEAKEGVKIERENQTLATVTFQNYFRMYNKLGGMTGTADTEAVEFKKIYNLDVLVVPTNLPMVRDDLADVVYRTEVEKFNAAVEEIKERNETGQPVLVGTISIERSELLSSMLKKAGVKHHVLNAKAHEREAEIVAQAGRLGALTISTNMAGRGTDIVLGGNPEFMAAADAGTRDPANQDFIEALAKHKAECGAERDKVIAAGGLHILGTERHESRRIDNQLRGRSGRQGDAGSSRFYLSLEDDLMRRFGADRIQGLMQRLGMEEGVPIEHTYISRAIENAQKKVEAHNFDVRKHLLEYDDVMNKQREVLYHRRREVLAERFAAEVEDDRFAGSGGHVEAGDGEDDVETVGLKDEVLTMAREAARGLVGQTATRDLAPEEWDWKSLDDQLFRQFSLRLGLDEAQRRDIDRSALEDLVLERVRAAYEEKEQVFTASVLRRLEKVILLQTIDSLWKDHLLIMDHLKEGVGLSGYAQQNPLTVYKKEGFERFEEMMAKIQEDAVEKLFAIQPARDGGAQAQGEWAEDEDVAEAMAVAQPRQAARPAHAAPQPAMRVIERFEQQREQQKRQQMSMSHGSPELKTETIRRHGDKVGRNDACPCGSGKKYKKCHGTG